MPESDEIEFVLGDAIVSHGSTYQSIQRLGRGGNATTYLVQCTAGPWSGVPFCPQSISANFNAGADAEIHLGA